jgi:hypothetical protein
MFLKRKDNFNTQLYQLEMTNLVDEAIAKINTEKPDFLIFTVSIWTEANAAISSVCIDSEVNSKMKVEKGNERNKEYYERFIQEGDLEQAELFKPVETRNYNPADFELRDYVEMPNKSFQINWEETSRGKCWKLLERELIKIGREAFDKFRKCKIHDNFELSVNGRNDWCEFTWNDSKLTDDIATLRK